MCSYWWVLSKEPKINKFGQGFNFYFNFKAKYVVLSHCVFIFFKLKIRSCFPF